ncbi:MAG: GNAT family N-acetyltransferase, partial [Roseiflexaceae bacterium]
MHTHLQQPRTLTTARLHWRPLQVSDAAAIYRQFSDPEMCRYFTEPPCSYSDAQDIISHYRTSAGRYMRWALYDAISGQFVGTCGYHCL